MPKTSILKKVALTTGAIAIVAGSLSVAKRVIDPSELVTGVVDGDTFSITNKQTIRLFNIDAPELGLCFSEEAKSALSKKILGKKVILKSPRTDYYKRVQAYVYVDGEFVNEYMAKNGYAMDHGNGAEESDRVVTAGNFAKENKIGIYSEKCSPSKPPKANCVVKGQVPYDYDNKTKVYLIPGCWNYTQAVVEKHRGENWFCTEAEAQKAGFTKALNCP